MKSFDSGRAALVDLPPSAPFCAEPEINQIPRLCAWLGLWHTGSKALIRDNAGVLGTAAPNAGLPSLPSAPQGLELRRQRPWVPSPRPGQRLLSRSGTGCPGKGKVGPRSPLPGRGPRVPEAAAPTWAREAPAGPARRRRRCRGNRSPAPSRHNQSRPAAPPRPFRPMARRALGRGPPEATPPAAVGLWGPGRAEGLAFKIQRLCNSLFPSTTPVPCVAATRVPG